MKVYDKLIRVSKKQIREKLFDVDVGKLSKKELKKVAPFLPTPEEVEFMEVFRSHMPELARLQRKMAVCLDVEVTELEEDRITFLFGRDSYTLTDPANSFLMCQALEKGVLQAVEAMALQKCILKNGEPVQDLRTGLKMDEVTVVKNVADKFFFQTFLA